MNTFPTCPAHTAAPAADRLDRSYVQLVANGNSEFEKEMLQSAAAEINVKMNALKEAVLAGEREHVKRYAHSLKNLANIAGARLLLQHCEQLEADSKSAPASQLEQQTALCEWLWQQASACIAALLAEA